MDPLHLDQESQGPAMDRRACGALMGSHYPLSSSRKVLRPPVTAPRLVLPGRSNPNGWCPATPCVSHAQPGFEYPHPTNLAPITSAGADPGYQTHTAPSPYSYPPRPAHDSRNSSSTHGSPFPPTQPHPVPLPSQQSNVPPQSSATPTRTCTSGGRQRSGLNVHDMLNACDSTVDTAPIATCSTR
ncbi:uncharacterized protein N7446_007318 [Penicillium canescens]|uniref:uncharacterized protein n=1 Tax=Penicillium canescens TaxID=5083 RepID=UPI0026E0F1A3|nr:uncharacterized protein N7446_007318 [Penicillium canescens]KAJ6063198.1 hypothetical protein N7446_007318 [Penicillium canescens]